MTAIRDMFSRNLRQGGILQVFGVGYRRLGAAQPLHRQIEIVEGLLHDPGRNLG